ncbi:polysaccharide biosynthesis/export family protein [Neptunicella sp. SCSIO 80796]|uniref:polysaccharide biosynthesis/export family protein n=1 Tax=Neptunicella plasticusilytica TaxID=3117012 RepID=UPI003A4D7C39
MRKIRLYFCQVVGFICLWFYLLNVGWAQTTANNTAIERANVPVQNQSVDLSKYMQQQGSLKSHNINDGYIPSDEVSTNTQPQPFGANLFKQGLETSRGDGLNPDYLIAPGDKISVQLWGTVELAEVFIVDNQGNIFIPQIGPVSVMDIKASELNQVVTSRIKSVYTNNVNIYVNLLTATPISVYVSGPVIRPGQYAGLPSESVLYFLNRAGGVDPDRGSYRRISVLRDNQTLISYDLYDFLREGKLPAFTFKDNDVILVSEQGPVITVEGAARYPFKFELTQNHSNGKDLVYYARPLSKTSHVAVNGNRTLGPISVYIPLEEFLEFPVSDGDIVLFNDDLRPQVISVQISGSYVGPSFYTVKKDVRLKDLLDHIEVDPALANIDSIYIKRKSVVEQQKQLLELSLQRLERSVFTAPAASDGESRIRAQEAQLVMKFVERARSVKPLGKVVLSVDGQIANVRLEQGDEIVIPQNTDLVQVSGEVLLPQAIVYSSNASIADYVAWSGGYSERANVEQVAIVHANGLTSFVSADDSHWFVEETNYQIKPGDQILVLPKVDTKVLQAVKDITQIIYQIAVAANVAIN